LHIETVKRSGSPSTVFASFLHFDLCFTVWVLLGALSVYITKDLGLNNAEKGLLVAIPTLSGSITRIFIGLLSDRFGGKIIGTVMLAFLFIPLLMGWLLPVNFPLVIVIGLLLGTAGASFAVALPLASHWYPPSQQGLVMGVAAAGNMGTVIANLFAPRLANLYGWHAVMGLAMIPVVLVLVAFALLAKDSPSRPQGVPMSSYLGALKSVDMLWFCLFYSVTFGGFVGLGTFLPTFFNVEYKLSAIDAGSLTALAALAGSTLRPVGGYLADKFGGIRMLTVLFAMIGILYTAASFLPPINIMSWLIVIGVGSLGMGNGSVFQLVPQRFRKEIGVATGVIGALGGVGGFFLPTLLGSVKQLTGSFASGMVVLAIFSFVSLIALRLLVASQKDWRNAWATTTTPQPEKEAVPALSTVASQADL
jgi:NNP family nitrate/nitrite transporter-like MFS transporter